jgi:hypothetical protein
MFAKGRFRRFFIAALAGAFSLLAIWTVPAHAQISIPQAEPKCVNCHENLYWLHDTGKWFCLNEDTPMTCVGCHGGNPQAVTQEAAHAKRAAYPAVNENISKCQECHPKQASERVALFSQVAGIGFVKVSLPYRPAIAAGTGIIPVTAQENKNPWVLFLEIASLILLAGLTLTAYFVYKIRHKTNCQI